MKLHLQTFGLILVSAASAFGSILTGPVYNPANGHTYYLLDSSPWGASETEAVSLGGHLVTVNDAGENNFLLATFSNYGGIAKALWTGLNDAAVEGSFVWTSGQTSPYTNWEGGRPDDGGGAYPTEDYVLIWPSPGPRSPGQWNDYIGFNTFPDMPMTVYGVVEVPEPTSLAFFVAGIAGTIFVRSKTARSGCR